MSGTAPLFTEAEVRQAINQSATLKAAAALLGVSRQTLYRYMEKYEITVRRNIAA